jgi:hypothetical protein
MIIVKIIGGLGNQMFQYAMGRALAIENSTELKLDISAFEWYKLHKYGLNKLNIVENLASDEENKLFLKGEKKFGLNRIVKFFVPYYKRSYISEKAMSYDPNMKMVKDNVYLDGYWGSEKYFKKIEIQLRKEFTLKEDPNASNLEMARKILEENAISIHIRRGDYVTDSKTNAIHGTCSLDYYHRAIEDVLNYQPDPHFFIFSNDLQWVTDNFIIPYPMTLVNINGADQGYKDMRLMSLCRHHIIANSTFSWWGAWLGEYKNKRVYSPERWYNVDYDIQDLIPDSWHKI